MARGQVKLIQAINDERVTVTRFEFQPGDETGWHVHGFDYVITAITPCNLLIEHPDGSSTTTQINPGDVYRRDCGVEHNVINGGDEPMVFVEVELK